MQNEQETIADVEEEFGTRTDALVKLGLITVGTQISTEIIHRLARNPLIVFGLGAAVGFCAHKYRKSILRTARQIQYQGKRLLPFNADSE